MYRVITSGQWQKCLRTTTSSSLITTYLTPSPGHSNTKNIHSSIYRFISTSVIMLIIPQLFTFARSIILKPVIEGTTSIMSNTQSTSIDNLIYIVQFQLFTYLIIISLFLILIVFSLFILFLCIRDTSKSISRHKLM